MINVLIQNVIAKKLLLLPHINICSRVDQLNLNFKKFSQEQKKAWDTFIKPGLKLATPLISAAVAAKTKSPQSAQITNTILKSFTGGKILSLTDMHGHGLRLKVMYYLFQKKLRNK